jgi:hypothetical protein
MNWTLLNFPIKLSRIKIIFLRGLNIMSKNIHERLLSKMDIIDKCWNWTGSKNGNGYGVVIMDGKSVLAHRASYETYRGPIPENLIIRHRCDNPLCCNPNHLQVGTRQENMKDVDERGRRPKGSNHWKCKLTYEQLETIKYDTRKQVEIAAEYGITQAHVSLIKKDKARR